MLTLEWLKVGWRWKIECLNLVSCEVLVTILRDLSMNSLTDWLNDMFKVSAWEEMMVIKIIS